jgi:hypothetical protein
MSHSLCDSLPRKAAITPSKDAINFTVPGKFLPYLKITVLGEPQPELGTFLPLPATWLKNQIISKAHHLCWQVTAAHGRPTAAE